MKIVSDYMGKRFNRLVIDEIPSYKIFTTATKVRLKCDCGNFHFARLSNLIQGTVQSCGCLKKENIGNVNKSHGVDRKSFYARLSSGWNLERAMNEKANPGQSLKLRALQ